MPTPLPDAERRRLVQGLLDRGATREQIMGELARAEGYVPRRTLETYGGAGREIESPEPNVIDPYSKAPYQPIGQVPKLPEERAKMIRQAVAGLAPIAAAPLTAGMSLIPAALAEAGIVGTADLGLQGARKLADPGYEINPRESFDIGATSGLASGATRGILTGLQRLFGHAGGIPGVALNEVLEEAPAGGRKAARMIRAAKPEAEYRLAQEAQGSALKQRAPSLPEAEAEVAAKKGQIDTTPILQRIMDRYRANPVNPGEEAANKGLDALAERLPPSMTMEQLEDYLRRIRVPVQDVMGKEGGTLAQNDVMDIQAFIRSFRDKILGDKGASAFARSSREIEAIRRFRSLLVTPQGHLKRSAENTLRRLPGNRVIMDVIARYDAVAGTDFAKKAHALALKRMWTPTDLQDAGALTEMLAKAGKGGMMSRLAGPPARGIAKAITVAAPPRGYPRVIAGSAAAAIKAGEEEDKHIRAKENP